MRGRAARNPWTAAPGRARTASTVVVLVAAGALIAGCSGGAGDPDPSATGQSSGATSAPATAMPTPTPTESASATAEPQIPEIAEADLLDTEGWDEFSNGFVEFAYPPGWDVVESSGPAASWLMDVVDESGTVVAQFTPEPFEGDADGPITVSAVDELARLDVATAAADGQVLLTAVTEPAEAAPEQVRKLRVTVLDPEQADAWLADLQTPLGFQQSDDEWAFFGSTDEFMVLDGEPIEDPTDAQIAEFMGTERYLRLLTMMASLG